MSLATNLVLVDIGVGVGLLAVALKGLISGHKGAATQVQIAVGSGAPNMGGSVPHVAVFDESGSRIGMYQGNENGHIDSPHVSTISIENSFAGGKEKQAEYLMLSMHESDAICVSMVAVAGDGAQWTWLGDMGKRCDADWYPSNFKLGDGTYTPACVWLDADHTKSKSGKIKAQGFALHMPDFSGADGRAAQYSDNPDTLCKSRERMTFYPELGPDPIPPVFNPPLQYTEDGADTDIKRIVNRKTKLYPNTPSRTKRNQISKRQDRNLDSEHLVVSDNPLHSAKEVCEHPSALGWDFVSTVEGTYCDISSGFWWYLCSEKNSQGCFDLEKKAMRGNEPGHKGLQGRDDMSNGKFPDKSYNTTTRWNH